MEPVQHTETIPQRVLCAKPGRVWAVRLCAAVLAVLAALSVPAVVWAYYVSGENLNRLPVVPRLLLALAAGLAAWGLVRSLREEVVALRLDFGRETLTLTYAPLPSVWREGTRGRVLRIPYRSVSSARLDAGRGRMILRSRGYTRSCGGGPEQKRAGMVTFSIPDAGDADLQALLRQYGGIVAERRD